MNEWKEIIKDRKRKQGMMVNMMIEGKKRKMNIEKMIDEKKDG